MTVSNTSFTPSEKDPQGILYRNIVDEMSTIAAQAADRNCQLVFRILNKIQPKRSLLTATEAAKIDKLSQQLVDAGYPGK